MNGNAPWKWLGALCIVGGLVGLFMAYGSAGSARQAAAVPEGPPLPRVSCKVLTVYDGDTIGCDLNGDGRVQRPREEVRFLGVDTPEMHYSRKNRLHGKEDEPFARAASRWVHRQLQGQTVYLESDARPFDPYGRRLAHVFRSERGQVSVGEELLQLGYASVLFIEPNRRYQARFMQVEHQARMRGQGLWGHWEADVSD